MNLIFTIGHSTRDFDLFLSLLRSHSVSILVDIRRLPGSSRYPQYNQGPLMESLLTNGIRYVYMEELGGRRGRREVESDNSAWENESFRRYADYMQTDGFCAGIDELVRLTAEGVPACMCSEAVWWRCHRRLVADALLVRGVDVRHIMGPGPAPPHSLTPFARVDGLRITYPGGDSNRIESEGREGGTEKSF